MKMRIEIVLMLRLAEGITKEMVWDCLWYGEKIRRGVRNKSKNDECGEEILGRHEEGEIYIMIHGCINGWKMNESMMITS